MKQNQENIDALLSLLDEQDKETYTQIEKEILSLGNTVSSHLSKLEEQTQSEIIKKRSQNLMQKIRYNQCISEFKTWIIQNNHYNWDFIYILSEFCDPSFNRKETEKIISDFQAEFYDRYPELSSPEEIVNVLRDFIFNHHRFEFDFNPFSLENLSIKNFFQRKKGTSFLFTMLFSILGQSRHYYILPVTFPQNIVLALAEPNMETKEWDILFYINPANGEIFSRSGIELFLKKNDIEPNSLFFAPSSTIKIAFMYAKQLAAAHKEAGNLSIAEQLNEIVRVTYGR